MQEIVVNIAILPEVVSTGFMRTTHVLVPVLYVSTAPEPIEKFRSVPGKTAAPEIVTIKKVLVKKSLIRSMITQNNTFQRREYQ